MSRAWPRLRRCNAVRSPISERLIVVEEDATWPKNQAATRVATGFRVAGAKVTAAAFVRSSFRAGPGIHLPRDGRDPMNAPGPGQLLFTFVPHRSQRSHAGDASLAKQGRLVLVTEAVAALVSREEPATAKRGGGRDRDRSERRGASDQERRRRQLPGDRGHPVRWPQTRKHDHTHFRRTQAVSAIGSAKDQPELPGAGQRLASGGHRGSDEGWPRVVLRAAL